MVSVGFLENIRKIELKFYGNIEWSDISSDLEIKREFVSLFTLHQLVVHELDKKYTLRGTCHFGDDKWIGLNNGNILLCASDGIRIEYYLRKKEQIPDHISKIGSFLPMNDILKWTQTDSHVNSYYEPYMHKYEFILQKIWRYGYQVCSTGRCLQSNADVIIQSDVLPMGEKSIFNDVVWNKSDLFSKKFKALQEDIVSMNGVFISNMMFSKHTGFNMGFTIKDDNDDNKGHSVEICLTSMNAGNYIPCQQYYDITDNYCKLRKNTMYQARFERNTFTIVQSGLIICQKEMHLEDNVYVHLMVHADGKRNNLEFNIHHFGLSGDINKIKYQFKPILSDEETKKLIERKDKMKLFKTVTMEELPTMETDVIDDFNFDMCLNDESRFI